MGLRSWLTAVLAGVAGAVVDDASVPLVLASTAGSAAIASAWGGWSESDRLRRLVNRAGPWPADTTPHVRRRAEVLVRALAPLPVGVSAAWLMSQVGRLLEGGTSVALGAICGLLVALGRSGSAWRVG